MNEWNESIKSIACLMSFRQHYVCDNQIVANLANFEEKNCFVYYYYYDIVKTALWKDVNFITNDQSPSHQKWTGLTNKATIIL